MTITRQLQTPWRGVQARLADSLDEPADRAERRRHQSRAARALAVEMLGGAGVAVDVIGRGEEGDPLWPPGWTGSLAHTDGCVAAAVAPLEACAGLGIDVEPDAPLPADAARLVLRPEESSAAGRAAFCAKECVHKALHPLTGAWLELDEVRIVFGADQELFTPEPVSAAAVAAFGDFHLEGRVWRIDGFLVALLHVR